MSAGTGSMFGMAHCLVLLRYVYLVGFMQSVFRAHVNEGHEMDHVCIVQAL